MRFIIKRFPSEDEHPSKPTGTDGHASETLPAALRI
jgi:hypothetical protein